MFFEYQNLEDLENYANDKLKLNSNNSFVKKAKKKLNNFSDTLSEEDPAADGQDIQ
jgi:hypothetical protein